MSKIRISVGGRSQVLSMKYQGDIWDNQDAHTGQVVSVQWERDDAWPPGIAVVLVGWVLGALILILRKDCVPERGARRPVSDRGGRVATP